MWSGWFSAHRFCSDWPTSGWIWILKDEWEFAREEWGHLQTTSQWTVPGHWRNKIHQVRKSARVANPTTYRDNARIKWVGGDCGTLEHAWLILRGSSYSAVAKTMWKHEAKEGRAANFQEMEEVQSFMSYLLTGWCRQLIQSLKTLSRPNKLIWGQIWPSSYQFATSALQLRH